MIKTLAFYICPPNEATCAFTRCSEESGVPVTIHAKAVIGCYVNEVAALQDFKKQKRLFNALPLGYTTIEETADDADILLAQSQLADARLAIIAPSNIGNDDRNSRSGFFMHYGQYLKAGTHDLLFDAGSIMVSTCARLRDYNRLNPFVTAGRDKSFMVPLKAAAVAEIATSLKAKSTTTVAKPAQLDLFF